MKQYVIPAAVAGFLVWLWTGDGYSSPNANKDDYVAAMASYFERNGELCLNVQGWPIDIATVDHGFTDAAEATRGMQMVALESAGLVRGEDVEIELLGIDGKPLGRYEKKRRYTRTDAAKPFARSLAPALASLYRDTGEEHDGDDFCYGKAKLAEIVKWDAPIRIGAGHYSEVTYRYGIDKIADWARRDDMQAAFPQIRRAIDGADGDATHSVWFTLHGWKATMDDDGTVVHPRSKS